jgi:hypothetical protein
MLNASQRIPKKIGGYLQPILPLIPEEIGSSDDEKHEYIGYELKAKAGDTRSHKDAARYKKYVRKFNEGSPQQWITLMTDLDEILLQNSIETGEDAAATVRTLIRGESGTTFDAALSAAIVGKDDEILEMTKIHVDDALAEVAETVFPHRALETQKNWMTRGMKKPRAMSTRSMSSAVTRLNNALPRFPNADEDSKFSEQDLLGLLEWSLPAKWLTAFDLKGYIPTHHSRAKLIAECEALERNLEATEEKPEKHTEKSKHSKKRKHDNKVNSRGNRNGGSDPKKKYFCKEHGKDANHPTNECWTLKKRNEQGHADSKPKFNRTFSNKSFRKEVHMLSKNSSETKVLDLYECQIQKARVRIARKNKKQRERAHASREDSSDSDMSINNVEPITRKKRSNGKNTDVKQRSQSKSSLKQKEVKEKPLDEEQNYQKMAKVAWLKDHGGSDHDEENPSSSESN